MRFEIGVGWRRTAWRAAWWLAIMRAGTVVGHAVIVRRLGVYWIMNQEAEPR